MRILLLADKFNSRFYGQAAMAIEVHDVRTLDREPPMLSVAVEKAKGIGAQAIVMSHDVFLADIVRRQTGKVIPLLNKQKKPTNPSNNWAGACFNMNGMKIIISRPFSQLVKLPYANFLLSWYCNKHLDKNFPRPTTPVPDGAASWTLATPNNIERLYEDFSSALYMAVDIETRKIPVDMEMVNKLRLAGEPVDGLYADMTVKKSGNKVPCIPIIDMIGYCGLFRMKDGSLKSHSIVLNIRTMDDINWMRRFNSLEATKIMQNGSYDSTYLIGRYNAPLKNWLCDTFHFMHSWYAELPRTLNFIGSMFIDNYVDWKDEIESSREEYNAKDTYYTLWSWVFMVNLAPQWAKDNYLIEFRKVFPNITCGLEGLLRDRTKQEELRELYTSKRNAALDSLETILYKGFNPASSQQVLNIMNAFSLAKFKKSDKKALERFANQGVLEAHIADLIGEVRECNIKLNTFINSTDFAGRLLYEINAGGTDTGRSASKASNLWTGTQIQNQDNKLRVMYIADDGWLLANCDGSQAESRTTAYISEDETLIDSVENAKDFHTRNASLFFGIPEDEIIKLVYDVKVVDGVEVEVPRLDDEGKQVKDKSLRTLSKRVNHGANYNMGPAMLLQTMGVANVIEAKKLLGLRGNLTNVCSALLQAFEDTYPLVKGKYYDEVINEIAITHRLRGATGWTRYCFERPSRQGNKLILNKYVAHPPQSLSVMLIDEAMFDFWYEYQIKRGIARLKAQVHDEVLYMVRPEHYEITKPALSALMSRPIMVKGRELIIPNDGGSASTCWGDLKD